MALKARLAKLAERLQSNEALLKKARRRHKKFRERAEHAHAAQIEHQESADLTRKKAKGNIYYKGLDDLWTAKANRAKRRAERAHNKAIYWKGKIKLYLGKIHHLEKSVEELETDLARWKKEHGVYFEGHNKVRGGTPAQRKRAAIHKARLNYQNGNQPGYYSQEGAARAYGYALYHYPYGHIWDCSTFADAIHYACGLESPSGSEYKLGGYTGTELANAQKVACNDVRSGDLCVYLRYPGDTDGHHVEVVDDPAKETTIGHGDSAINSGVFNLFGDDLYEFRRSDKELASIQ